jgi:geranylgeranyl reductase family protein
MDAEVIIVGAGPGGSYTAYKLAQAGVKVLVIEKESLPRYKSCGGAISGKANELLSDFNLNHLIEAKVNQVSFSYNLQDKINIKSRTPIVRLVMRDKFDHFLNNKAEQQGAKIITNSKVTDLKITKTNVEVTTNNNHFTARFIVGADGANSKVAEQLNLTTNLTPAVGLEKEIKVNPARLKRQTNKINLDYGVISKGYSWIFPKQDHLSVGVGTYKQGINLKQKLAYYLAKENLTDHEELTTKGQLIPIWREETNLNTDQALLVGDAAHLVDPLSGEGIYYALKSADLASQVLLTALNERQSLDKYTKLINETLVPEFKQAKLLAKPFLLFPKKIHQLLAANPQLLEEFLQIIYGVGTYNDLYKSFIGNIPFFNQLAAD